MRLIIDNREHGLYEKCESILSNDPGYATIETQVLPLGDILVKTDEGKDVMIIERKTLTDLLSSIKDGRYEEQSHRLKHASGFPSHNIVYIIEGMFSTLRTVMEKKLIISSIASLNYFKGFSVIRTSGIQETAELLIYMADKIDRNFMKGVLPSYLVEQREEQIQIQRENTFINGSMENIDEKNDEIREPIQEKSYSGFVKTIKKENITQDNISEIMLCQIPGISSVYAQSVLKFFGGFSNMVEKIKNGSANFENIMYETKGKQRRIPKTCGEQISKYIQGL
jgi:ERCC4-type nuclease